SQHGKQQENVVQDLAGWQAFWGLKDTGSLLARPRYQGGDVRAMKPEAREKLTAADFRLHPMSAGKGAGANGRDLGADVDRVGPVIQLSEAAIKAGGALLETNAPLTVEGLELQRVGTDQLPAEQSRKLLVSQRAPLHLAHCRFLLKGSGSVVVAAQGFGSPRFDVRSCFFAGESLTALNWVRPPEGRMMVENCVIAAPDNGLAVRQY